MENVERNPMLPERVRDGNPPPPPAIPHGTNRARGQCTARNSTSKKTKKPALCKSLFGNLGNLFNSFNFGKFLCILRHFLSKLCNAHILILSILGASAASYNPV